MRLFIAIEIPDIVCEQLSEIARGLPGVRWADGYHLTLKFLGEMSALEFAELQERLDRVRIDSFSLQLRGVGQFGLKGVPSVLWASVNDQPTLFELQKAVEKSLGEFAMRDKKKFQPHITLARLHGVTPRRLSQYLEEFQDFESDAFIVDSFHLFSSRLRPEGAVHTVERSYSLRSHL